MRRLCGITDDRLAFEICLPLLPTPLYSLGIKLSLDACIRNKLRITTLFPKYKVVQCFIA